MTHSLVVFEMHYSPEQRLVDIDGWMRDSMEFITTDILFDIREKCPNAVVNFHYEPTPNSSFLVYADFENPQDAIFYRLRK